MNNLKQIRRALDARAKDIAALGRTRELSLALTTCQQGRMLLGNALKLLGSSTPYPEASNPQSPRVEPPVDVTDADYAPNLPEDAIAAVKEVRRRFEQQILELDAARQKLWPRHVGTSAESVFEAAYVEILIAKSRLGMELSDRGAARDKKVAAAAKAKPAA